MATTVGPTAGDGKAMAGGKARGYAPGGHGPHGGHHRKHFDQVSANPMADHMRNNPAARANSADIPSPMGNVGG